MHTILTQASILYIRSQSTLSFMQSKTALKICNVDDYVSDLGIPCALELILAKRNSTFTTTPMSKVVIPNTTIDNYKNKTIKRGKGKRRSRNERLK